MLFFAEIGLWGSDIHKKRVESLSAVLSSICEKAFSMSASNMISAWQKRSNIPFKSGKCIGPLNRQSFNEWPSGTLTLASKTIRNFVVAWSFRKTGWCGKYDTWGLLELPERVQWHRLQAVVWLFPVIAEPIETGVPWHQTFVVKNVNGLSRDHNFLKDMDDHPFMAIQQYIVRLTVDVRFEENVPQPFCRPQGHPLLVECQWLWVSRTAGCCTWPGRWERYVRTVKDGQSTLRLQYVPVSVPSEPSSK